MKFNSINDMAKVAEDYLSTSKLSQESLAGLLTSVWITAYSKGHDSGERSEHSRNLYKDNDMGR